jgi:hypothetical protein
MMERTERARGGGLALPARREQCPLLPDGWRPAELVRALCEQGDAGKLFRLRFARTGGQDVECLCRVNRAPDGYVLARLSLEGMAWPLVEELWAERWEHYEQRAAELEAQPAAPGDPSGEMAELRERFLALERFSGSLRLADLLVEDARSTGAARVTLAAAAILEAAVPRAFRERLGLTGAAAGLGWMTSALAPGLHELEFAVRAYGQPCGGLRGRFVAASGVTVVDPGAGAERAQLAFRLGEGLLPFLRLFEHDYASDPDGLARIVFDLGACTRSPAWCDGEAAA